MLLKEIFCMIFLQESVEGSPLESPGGIPARNNNARIPRKNHAGYSGWIYALFLKINPTDISHLIPGEYPEGLYDFLKELL